MNDEWLTVVTVAAVGVLLIFTAWLATIFERARHQCPETVHVCPCCWGVRVAFVESCAELCVDCRFDAEEATKGRDDA